MGFGMSKKLIVILAAAALSVILVITVLMIVISNRNSGIEGTWILDHEEDQNGKEMTSGMLISIGVLEERYDISGTDVHYSCSLASSSQPITMDLVLEDLGDNRYNFNLPSGTTFATVTVYGKIMTYKVGTDEGYMKMFFLKK